MLCSTLLVSSSHSLSQFLLLGRLKFLFCFVAWHLIHKNRIAMLFSFLSKCCRCFRPKQPNALLIRVCPPCVNISSSLFLFCTVWFCRCHYYFFFASAHTHIAECRTNNDGSREEKKSMSTVHNNNSISSNYWKSLSKLISDNVSLLLSAFDIIQSVHVLVRFSLRFFFSFGQQLQA